MGVAVLRGDDEAADVGAVGGDVDGLGDGDDVGLLDEDVALELAPDLQAALGEGGLAEEAVELGDPGVLVLGVGVGAAAVRAVDALRALGDGEDGEAALLAVEVEAGAGAVPLALVDELDLEVDAELAKSGPGGAGSRWPVGRGRGGPC